MVRIAVVEDDPASMRELTGYLARLEKEGEESFRVSTFTGGHEIAYGYSADYDLILMDIELGAVSGMEAAEMIRRQDGEVIIIFITNSPQYAIRGYQVEALDYVLKPVSYYAFGQCIRRALERLKRRRSLSVRVSLGRGRMQRVNLEDIGYIEVMAHSLIYHTKNGNLTCTGNLKDLEEELADKGFFRCNKGYLVNLDLVEGMRGDNCLVLGEEVQVSRAKKKPFLDALNNHVNEVGR